MKRTMARILAAILILCMIPATVITAFARGKGVYGDYAENQSIDNANGQFIPETIKVDAKLNDTGWPESGFAEVNSNTGYWSTVTQTGNNSNATYKYQIRSDIEQLYVGATLTLPKLVDGQDTVTFYVFMKDGQSTSGNPGYTDAIEFKINVAAKSATVNVSPDAKSSVGTKNVLPAEAHQFEYDFSTDASGNTVVVLEMRNMLMPMFDRNGDISDVTYFVELDLPTGKADPAFDKLVHPKVAKSDSALFPTFDYWPTNSDGSAGGVPVDTTLGNGIDDLDYEVNVDGKFDEAVWSTLTNYYIHDEEAYDYEQNKAASDYASMSGDTVYGTGVKQNTSYFLSTNTTQNPGYDASYDSNDNVNDSGYNSRIFIRYKYEFRVDGDYLYGAVVAYVPQIKEYNDVDKELGSVKVTTSPDLCIMFYDNERPNVQDGGVIDDNEVVAANGINKGKGYLPETIMQIRSMYPQYIEGDAKYGQIFTTYANCWPSKYDGTTVTNLGWGGAMLDTGDKNQFEASRSARQSGDIWNFEFKIAIDKIPTDDNGDIVYSMYVADRYSVTAVSDDKVKLRAYAASGNVNSGETFSKVYPQYSYDRNVNNKITKAQIEAAKNIKVAEKSGFGDGKLDQALWAAVSGADARVDGKLKNAVLSDNHSFAYKLSADYEYIYGAVLLSGSWNANSWLKLHINRKKTYEELKASTYVDHGNGYNIVKTYTVSSASGQTIAEWEFIDQTTGKPQKAKDVNRTKLTDGVYHHDAEWGPDNANFVTYSRSGTNDNIRMNVDFELTELYTTKAITAYFSGGDETNNGMWGIYIPNNVEVFYSTDGVNYTSVSSTFVKTKKFTDTNGALGTGDNLANDMLHGYEYAITLDDYVSARYIRLQIEGWGGMVWMSEVDIFVTETHGEYYDANMRLHSGKSGRFYYKGDENKNLSNGEFDYNYVTYGTNERAVEFKISLNALNIDYDLAADELDEIFCYYVAVEEENASGVMHPRTESDMYINKEATNWLMDKTYDGANVFTYGDMLDDIRVDGKLDEKYWIGKDVEMQHVDSTNGTWQTDPTKGNSFGYDYKIYAGNNYLYGAAVIDVSAITADNPYVYENVPITRFDIWLDNGINEYDWVTDGNNKTNINVSNDTSDATDGELEGDHYNGAREYDFQYYTNYYYNIYLSKTDGSINVVPGAGNDFVCGGTTPQTLNDPDIASDDPKVTYPTNESRWSWGMSTVNGKTYVEFMIKLDDIYCTDKGFNYYVSATHTFGTETSDDTSDDETLTLMYPAIDDLGSNEPLWVTHINSQYYEGSGVIFTYEHTQGDEYKTWCESEVWWGFALLRPVTNGYEIIEISNGLDGKKKPIASDHFKQGDILYALNHGNDYIYIQNFKKTYPEQWDEIYGHITDYTLTTHAGKNYVNDNVIEMMARFRRWRVGDVLKFTFASDAQQRINNNDNNIFLAQNGFNYTGEGGDSLKALQWYEPAYVSQNYFALMKKGEERSEADAEAQIAYLPSTGSWNAANAATIKQLKHFAPETIKLDGIINEAGWAADKWIYVYETANGSLEQVTSLEEANNYKQVFKYQLRTDGEFLYLAAEIAQSYNEDNSPFVKLWLKSDSDAKTWTHYYDVSYGQSTLTVTAPTPTYELAPTPTTDAEKKNPAFFQGYEGKNGSSYNEAESLLTYNAALGFAANDSKAPAGEANKTLSENSLLYGFTDEIQENQTSGIYDPTIKTTKFYLAKESAVICESVDEKATWVEFKVALNEFGGENGFEYYVEAGYKDYHLFYPVTYVEPESERSYMNNYFPTWEWDSKNCAKVTAEDIAFGAIRMRNNCMPVVSLGAKVTDTFKHPDTGKDCKAIRFGVLYNEDYIRNWRKTDALPVDVSDVNHTDMKNDYWDVATVGVAFLPTMLLKEGEELTVSTPTVKTVPADNIVKWQSGDDVGGWSNFADYESFVFFVVVYGVPDNIKMSFRPYVDFYASAGTESYYGETFIRSYQMVVDNPYSEEEEGVLVPDYDENNPPFEDFTSRDI